MFKMVKQVNHTEYQVPVNWEGQPVYVFHGVEGT